MKRRTVYLLVASMLIAGGSAFGLLFFGVIWFNQPSLVEYPIRGVDVSNHQGAIDWQVVRRAGIAFAYIKATEGGDFVDKRFETNWKSARAHGIKVGAYHFFTLCRSGADQASNFIGVVPNARDALPPAIDLEFTGNCNSRPAGFYFQREIHIFYNLIKTHYGMEPVVYTTYEFHDAYDISQYLQRLWIRDVFLRPRRGLRWTFWQYSNRSSVSGIPGFVDTNVFVGSPRAFSELTRHRQ